MDALGMIQEVAFDAHDKSGQKGDFFFEYSIIAQPLCVRIYGSKMSYDKVFHKVEVLTSYDEIKAARFNILLHRLQAMHDTLNRSLIK